MISPLPVPLPDDPCTASVTTDGSTPLATDSAGQKFVVGTLSALVGPESEEPAIPHTTSPTTTRTAAATATTISVVDRFGAGACSDTDIPTLLALNDRLAESIDAALDRV